MNRPETYLAALAFLAMLALGFWYVDGFKLFFLVHPVIQG
jgi:hypothetical protein